MAAWIRAAGLDVPGLQVVGHSWGGMTAAALPLAGIRPATLVLLDPPSIPHAMISMMASDPSQRPYPDLESAVAGLAAANPTWPAGDVEAKADALVRLDVNAVLAVLLENKAIGMAASPTCRNPRRTASISGWSGATRQPVATFPTRCSPGSPRGSATTTC